MPLSKSQIDRVGERLKRDDYTEDDLRLLDQHRRSYGPAYMSVVRTIEVCGELPTGRPAKSTASIAEKLRRESIRLSQMQDIAGCRVVVKTIAEQARLVQTLSEACPGATVVDRRNKPSNGYRAVHIIARVEGKPIEIQVRTELQQMWAEVSERISDVMGIEFKYGGGAGWWREFLQESSEIVALHETCEANHTQSLELLQNIKAMLQRVLAVRDGTKMPVEGIAEGLHLVFKTGELRHQHEVSERQIAELEAALVHLCTCPETFDRGLQGLQQLVEDGLRVTSETEARLVDFRRRVVALLTGEQANLDRREVEKGT